MLRKLKTIIFIGLAGTVLSLPVLVPAVALAKDCATTGGQNIQGGLDTGIDSATGTTECDTDAKTSVQSGIESIARNAINIFSIIVGVVAVIMIIYGGFRYITSGGESSKIGNAKNTLVYAIIGLIIVALAQLIVHFVLNESTAINKGATSSSTIYSSVERW